MRDAYIKNARGEKLVDFKRCNLHLLGYSVPFKGQLSLRELRPPFSRSPIAPTGFHTAPVITRKTGVSVFPANDLKRFAEDQIYEVVVDAELTAGSLTYGEAVLPSRTSEEVLVSCHVCHPSLGNDNLSGIALATLLAAYLKRRQNWLTYRFLFIPGTIGSITWLDKNRDRLART